jgi:hypothetical protein
MSPDETRLRDEMIATLREMSPESQVVYIAATLATFVTTQKEMKDNLISNTYDLNKIKITAGVIGGAVAFVITAISFILNIVSHGKA